MHRINKPHQMYSVVLCDSSSYTLVIIEHDPITSLFIVHAYQTVKAEHGEFGEHFFINHTYFFKSVVDFFSAHNYPHKSVALLFKEPFITQHPHPLIPSLLYDDYALTYPLLLQCSLIPPIHGLTVSAVTQADMAHQTAVASTHHPYDEYTVYRLFTKKTGTDFIHPEQYYTIIAATGSYFMENV